MSQKPWSVSVTDPDRIQGKQSTLWSSALRKSKTIKATKAVTCRRKSKRIASAEIFMLVKIKQKILLPKFQMFYWVYVLSLMGEMSKLKDSYEKKHVQRWPKFSLNA